MKFNFFQRFKKKQKRIHLDFAATTPVHPLVMEAMAPYFSDEWANPNAVYSEGVRARRVIEEMRISLARTLRVRASDITFTSGGTESNNLALIGYIEALHKNGRAYADMEIISTRIEHPSITESLEYLARRGVRILYAPIDESGKIILKEFEQLLSKHTVLVTFAYVNSEIGVVEEVKKISRAVRNAHDVFGTKTAVHLDASQAPLWLPCALDMLGVDMMTLDAGKCYGPKGVGVLVHRHTAPLVPIMHGGGQEYGLRSGTESAALIVGCVTALVRAQDGYEARSNAVAHIRDYFLQSLTERVSGVVVNGSMESRVANNLHISLPQHDTEYLVVWLDAQGIAASTKSACGSGSGKGSAVVREMTHDESLALSTVRFTLGEETTKADIERAVACIVSYQALMQKHAF